MIYQLLKKHPITQQNIPRWNPYRTLLAVLGCLIVFSSTSISSADDEANLLDSLKNRSPVQRWRKRIEKKEIENKERIHPNIVNNKSEKNYKISDRYPLVLKPSILKKNAQRITHVSQLQDEKFSNDTPDAEVVEKNIVRKPAELRKITDIQPFYDYFPDKKEGEDPCRYLCPRPDGLPCDGVASDEQFECPEEVKLSEVEYEGRHFGHAVYHWEASNLHHNPLYFEDPSLERYGHTWPCYIQPFVSVGKFGVQLVSLPYQMTLDPVHKDQYTLGWYRPGECAPKKIYQIPLNAKAAAVEAGVVTGLIFAIP